MNKIIKEYKGVVIFYIIIIVSIFLVSFQNSKFNSNSAINTDNISLHNN